MPEHLPHDWFPRPLPANVRVGERSWIYSSYAFLHYRSELPVGVRIGDDTGVYIGTMFDLGPEAEVEIGDYCAVCGPVISTNGRVRIGSYTFISYGVVIADSPQAAPPDDRAASNLDGAAHDVVLEENVWVGAQAVLLGGTRVGEGAVVGAGTVVDFEVPPFAIVAGDPARVVGWAREQGAQARQ